jgi:prepilin-type N-terminal cleavage/methylation domain-containing protein
MKKSIRSKKSGFTLLEVLAATMIFVLAVFAVIENQKTSQHNIAQSQHYFIATTLARSKLTEMELKYQREFNTNGVNAAIAEESGGFEAPYQDYTWRVAITENTLELSAEALLSFMKSLGLDEDEAELQIEQQKLVLTNLNKMLKENFLEMKVEILWESRGRKYSLPVITHLMPEKPRIELTTTVDI